MRTALYCVVHRAQRRRRENESKRLLHRQRTHLPRVKSERRRVRGYRRDMGSHDVRRFTAWARERA